MTTREPNPQTEKTRAGYSLSVKESACTQTAAALTAASMTTDMTASTSSTTQTVTAKPLSQPGLSPLPLRNGTANLIVDHTSDLIALLEHKKTSWHIIEMNASLRRFLAHFTNPDSAVSTSSELTKLFPTVLAKRTLQNADIAMQAPGIYAFQSTYNSPHKKTDKNTPSSRNLDITIVPIRPYGTSLLRLLWIAQDTTPYSSLVTELALAQAEFEVIFDNAVTGIAIVDVDHTVIRANRRFSEMMATAPHALSTTRIIDLVSPEEQEILQKTLTAVATENKTVTHESMQFLSDNGKIVKLCATFSPFSPDFLPTMGNSPTRPIQTQDVLPVLAQFQQVPGSTDTALVLPAPLPPVASSVSLAGIKLDKLLAKHHRAMDLMVSRGSLEEILHTIIAAHEEQTPGVICAVTLQEGTRVAITAAPHFPEPLRALIDGSQISPDGPVPARTLYSGREVFCRNLLDDPALGAHKAVIQATGLRSCLSVPLQNAFGNIFGTFDLYHTEEIAPNGLLQSYLHSSQRLASIALDQERVALHDSLTGLPNRQLFTQILTRALERWRQSRSSVAVIFFDLDHFKVVNESLGHEAGDNLLLSVAERLRSLLGPDDHAVRFGGDEFIILCESQHTQEHTKEDGQAHATNMAKSIQKAMSCPFIADDGKLHIDASMGIAYADHNCAADTLLRDADAAMHRAKQLGKARYEIFDTKLHRQVVQRLQTERELRAAVEREEFIVYFQPEIDLRQNTLAGIEALVRWNHPRTGLIFPNDFIPLAEETGLIVPIGEQVLRQVCSQTSIWRSFASSHNLRKKICSWVNLSARQFALPSLVDTIASILQHTGTSPEELCVEITEHVIMEDMRASIHTLERLKELGIRLGIDDFGTGYSSLQYLKQFPVDILKIDRCFIQELGENPEDTSIVKTVIELGHALGLEVVAEGVETHKQLEQLRIFQCDTAQGYLFSRPVPTDTLIKKLTDGSIFAPCYEERTSPKTEPG